jgi:Tfp pilus assembly protein PilF/predicted aspartyl protease
MKTNSRCGVTILCVASALGAAAVDDTVSLGRKALLNEGVILAWKLSQKALAEAPESAAAHELAGEVLFRRGDFAQAEKEFQKAQSLDPNLALASWGLARIAGCRSLRKTAGQHMRRAHELDPRNRRIVRDWAMALQGQEHLEALEKYASLLDGEADANELRGVQHHIKLDRALNGRKLNVLASPYEKSEIPLAKLVRTDSHLRAYGLDLTINGKNVRLLIDTGAGGIMIKRRAAEGAGVPKLADATFHGIGNNAKLPAGYLGVAERVRIGKVEFHDALISIADQDVTPEDGLIGTNVFSDFLVTLDFAAGKLRLNPLPGYDPSDSEPQDGAVPAEMRNFARVFQFGHMLLLPTRVSNSRERLFGIDTGSARTLISYDTAAEVGKIDRDERMRLSGINGRVSDVYQTGNLSLEFAGFRQTSVGMTAFDMWDQSRNLGTEVSGLLGLPLLELFTLTIDYRDGLVNFDYQERSRTSAR